MLKALLIVFFIGLFLNASFADEMEIQFEKFMKDYNKQYPSIEERNLRFVAFKKNIENIQKWNKESNSVSFAVNDLSDKYPHEISQRFSSETSNMPEELKALAQSKKSPSFLRKVLNSFKRDIAESFDLRELGFVTGIKDQGLCGSCYAFTTAAMLESGWLKRGYHTNDDDFSVQDILDCCDNNYCNRGCQGGSIYYALSYVGSKGIATEKSYPYTSIHGGSKGNCVVTQKAAMATNVQIIGPASSEVQEYLSKNQIAVGAMMYASSEKMSYYKSGIMDSDTCGSTGHTSPNHAVTIVGWGKDQASGYYWIIKNSWGTGWGESGYFRAKFGSCLIDDNVKFTSDVDIYHINYVALGFTILASVVGCACIAMVVKILFFDQKRTLSGSTTSFVPLKESETN